MKKRIITIVMVAILVFSLMISASAASFGHLADDLKSLGLFQGTDAGYELERAPKRGEALAMLIRLYGLDGEAQACTSKNPFADVPETSWLSPYVAFAFEKGFTTGTSATTFDPDDLCSAQMYVTYVLRALGYSDAKGDFTYDKALEFGAGVGIFDGLIGNGDFLRDQMVAVSYLALLAKPNGGEYDTLLTKLVANGAVGKTPADAMTEKLDLLDEVVSIGTETDDAKMAMAMTMGMKANMGLLGTLTAGMGLPGNFTADMDISVIVDGQILCALNVEMDMAGDKTSIPIYFAEGFIYIDNNGEKIKMDAGIGNQGSLPAANETTAGFNLPPYIFSEIKKDAKGDGTEYSVKIIDSLLDRLMVEAMKLLDGSSLGEIGLGNMDLGGMNLNDMNLAVNIPQIVFVTDSDGKLQRISFVINLSITLDIMGTAITNPITLSMEMEVTATGDDVKIELPDDLDTYRQVSRNELTAGVS